MAMLNNQMVFENGMQVLLGRMMPELLLISIYMGTWAVSDSPGLVIGDYHAFWRDQHLRTTKTQVLVHFLLHTW